MFIQILASNLGMACWTWIKGYKNCAFCLIKKRSLKIIMKKKKNLRDAENESDFNKSFSGDKLAQEWNR